MATKKQRTITDAFGGEKYADILRYELETGHFPTKGDRTRQRLRIAAAETLEETGYQDLKVSSICERASVALGTFYVYFTDKTEISIDIVLGFVNHLYVIAQQVSRGKDEYTSIYNTNLCFTHAYNANGGLMRCLVQLQSHEPGFREVWEPRHEEWLQTLARSLEKRTKEPGISHKRALNMALALEGMVFSYLYAVAVERESPIAEAETDPEEIAHLLSLLWYRATHGRNPETK